MRKKNTKTRKYRKPFLRGIVLGLCLAFIIYIAPAFIPGTVNALFGETILDHHISDLNISSNMSPKEKADIFLTWQQKTIEPYNSEIIFKGMGWSIQEVNGRKILFIRSPLASWFILTERGNCGENSEYFMQVMNRSGHYARTISAVGEDHVIAQYDNGSDLVFVDPSEGTHIENLTEMAERMQWSRIVATDTDGHQEDITKSIIPNISTLTIKYPSSILNYLTNVRLSSTYLMNRSDMYSYPIPVYYFSRGNTSIDIQSKKDYELSVKISLGIVEYSYEQALDLSNDQELDINSMVEANNLHITLIGYFILGLMALILLIWTIKRYQLLRWFNRP